MSLRVDDERLAREAGSGGKVWADVGPRVSAVRRPKEVTGLLVSTREKCLSHGVGEVDADRIVVRHVTEGEKRRPVVGRPVDAAGVVDARFPERLHVRGVV